MSITFAVAVADTVNISATFAVTVKGAVTVHCNCQWLSLIVTVRVSIKVSVTVEFSVICTVTFKISVTFTVTAGYNWHSYTSLTVINCYSYLFR